MIEYNNEEIEDWDIASDNIEYIRHLSRAKYFAIKAASDAFMKALKEIYLPLHNWGTNER